MPDCLFCKIIRGELPTNKIYEDEKTFAFLDINPVNPGHTLVVPKKHAVDVFEIDEEEWNAVMGAVKKISLAVEKALQPTGINLGMNNKSGAGQVVFHAHVHIMPRFQNDGHELWKGKPYGAGEAAKIAEKIRGVI
ncbi:HIT family protein [Candidatus Kaiserbacteria bacterium]|nr:HIT family protein [Candidatus Kaiserbacteria bacterium]